MELSVRNSVKIRKTFIFNEFSEKFRVTLNEVHITYPRHCGKFEVLSVNFNGFSPNCWIHWVNFKEILGINHKIP